MNKLHFWEIQSRERLAIILCSILFGAAAFFLYTQNHHTPYHWHPDEPSKIRQIKDGGQQNFRHPKLMIQLARFTKFITGARTKQERVEAGRMAVAFSAVLVVVFLAIYGWECAGWYGYFLTGVYVTLVPPLFEAASYFKEDPVLMMGLSAWLLCAVWYMKEQNTKTAILLGIATALTCSGKHVGVISVIFSIIIVLFYARLNKQQRTLHLSIIAGITAILYALINFEILLTPSRGLYDLGFELKQVTKGHHGITRGATWIQYLNMLVIELGWPLVITSIIAAVLRIRTITRETLPLLLPLFIAIAWFLMLSLGKSSSTRYMIPVITLVAVFVGVQLGSLLAAKGKLYQRVLVLILAFIVATPMIQRLLEYDTKHRYDKRAVLKGFVDKLPTDTRIRADSYTGLLPFDKTGRHGRDYYFSLKNGESPDDLLAEGYTHLAISSGNYERYLEGDFVGKNNEAKYKRKAAYTYVLKHGKPIWSYIHESNNVGYTLYLYDLKAFY